MLSNELNLIAARIEHEVKHERSLTIELLRALAWRLRALAENAELLERVVVPPAARADVDLTNVVMLGNPRFTREGGRP